MKNKLEAISDILDDHFKSDNITKLVENQCDMSIDFVSGPQRFLSFNFDKQLSPKEFPKGIFPFFKKGRARLTSFCDYIIFTERAGKLYILLIELKKGTQNVTKQLSAGKCFAEFIISTLNRVHEVNLKPEYRSISIRDTHVKIKPKAKQKEVEYVDGFCTFSDSKFWLLKYLN